MTTVLTTPATAGAGLIPCLQCAPAEDDPDGPPVCQPRVCPSYRTNGIKAKKTKTRNIQTAPLPPRP